MIYCIHRNLSRVVALNAALFFFITTASFAATSKEKSPAQLSSDSALCKHQVKEDICVYSGKAKFKQGTTYLQAEQITIHRVGDKINKIVASGKHSSYSNVTEANKQQMGATADLITIDPNKNTMVLEKNGQLSLGQDTYSGSHIEYKFK